MVTTSKTVKLPPPVRGNMAVQKRARKSPFARDGRSASLEPLSERNDNPGEEVPAKGPINKTRSTQSLRLRDHASRVSAVYHRRCVRENGPDHDGCRLPVGLRRRHGRLPRAVVPELAGRVQPCVWAHLRALRECCRVQPPRAAPPLPASHGLIRALCLRATAVGPVRRDAHGGAHGWHG